ncbi:DUF2851 family protein [Belliella kenyensis]|uniref:DUF2851 family protein n=1 Tax=Belliella kenyensis TaxID=1472724 RepID=A0ABV8EQX0_9BACT|nr:DUF2851 family protein [Belliella kenyensis]MCH7402826.1 DUF2851 family protein [Belliella kenyensis]MDN3602532.1 DUF2851 family protein [Belliella kenyensis]
MKFQEDFLQTVWKYQYFDKQGLDTSNGDSIQIKKIGFHNFYEGPDFLEAHVQIGKLEYFGHVEVHLKASDWKHHEHDSDPRYNSVILHVVWEEDKPIFRKDGTPVPTLVLKGRILLDVLRNYERLISGNEALLCSESIHDVADIIKFSALEKALVERLDKKSSEVLEILDKTKGDWEEACFQWMMRAFGFKTNANAMEHLSAMLTIKMLKKHGGSSLIIQAILLGQAGLIPDEVQDEYGKILKGEFDFHSKKYSLPTPMHFSQWKFMGVRPGNFPTYRLVQLGEIISKSPNLLSTILNDSANFKTLQDIFDITIPDYWRYHYHFDKKSGKKISGKISVNSFNLLIINFVVPIWFAYGKYLQESHWQERCFDLLQSIVAEENFIVRKFSSSGWNAQNSFDSQGMIGLFRANCQQKKCLECKVGQNLLKPSKK